MGKLIRSSCAIAAVLGGVLAVPAVTVAEEDAAPVGVLTAGQGSFEPRDGASDQIAALHPSVVARARALGLERGVSPRAATARGLGFPLRLKTYTTALSGTAISNYIDRDASGGIQDFACGTHTYNGHNGTDIMLAPFAWSMMDKGDVQVVAAAAGTIVAKSDGAFDRVCSPNGSEPANFVVVRHADGTYAYYWHLKKGTVTSKAIGSAIPAGYVLGLVGSSGNSTGPHLHFEMRTAADFGGSVLDPWHGACNSPTTLWRHQAETLDTSVLRVATHSAAPNVGGNCDNPAPNYSDQFVGGATLYAAVYLRDQRPDTPVTLTVRKPDNSVWTSFTTPAIGAPATFNYWWTSTTLPTGVNGRWRLQATLEGRTYEHNFLVGSTLAPTTLVHTITPTTASATNAAPAKIKVSISNTGASTAVGCAVALDAPIAAIVSLNAISGGAPSSSATATFDLAAGAAKDFQLTVKPKGGYKANAAPFPVRVTCDNAGGSNPGSKTILTLTF